MKLVPAIATWLAPNQLVTWKRAGRAWPVLAGVRYDYILIDAAITGLLTLNALVATRQ
jgi:hypothetical protein